MNALLLVLPFCANDGVLAEQLCDFIYLLNKRVQRGHILLVASPDTHAEMREKVRIAAEVAFETVDMIQPQGPPTTSDKNAKINQMLLFTFGHIAKNYRSPFMLIEPDCCPLKPEWLDKISESYHSQPRRYCGSFMQVVGGKGLFMARVACYPHDCQADLVPFLGATGIFNLNAGNVVIPKATKTKLVQELNFTDEGCIGKLNEAAVLLHHDKNGIMLNKLRNDIEHAR